MVNNIKIVLHSHVKFEIKNTSVSAASLIFVSQSSVEVSQREYCDTIWQTEAVGLKKFQIRREWEESLINLNNRTTGVRIEAKVTNVHNREA